MELRHLRSFVVVAEELHFGRAAERLHMAGPPLSKRIQRLEAELGFPLLERSTRKVELTAGGQVFLARARRLLEELDTARSEAARAHRGDTGLISVGFSGSASWALVPKVLRAFRERYPAVRIEPRSDLLSERQLTAIGEGRLDVGFVRKPSRDPEIVTRTVWREPLVAMLPADHALAGMSRVPIAELAGEPFVSYWESMPLAGVVGAACERAGFTPDVAQRAGESYGVACLVAAGFGVALVPRAATHMRIAGVRFRPLPRAQTEFTTMDMAWRRHDPSPVLRNFVRLATRIADGD